MNKPKRVVLEPLVKSSGCQCPECSLSMRRLYVNGTIKSKEGKRRTKFIPIGYYCPYCNIFLSDRELKENSE